MSLERTHFEDKRPACSHAPNTLDDHLLATPDTPEGVVWLYGPGCIDTYHVKAMGDPSLNAVAMQDVEQAQAHLLNGMLPTKALVRRALPGPFKTLEVTGIACTTGAMYHLFRITHRTSPLTPTYIAEVTTVGNGLNIRYLVQQCVPRHDALRDRPHYVLNIHRYPLLVCEKVFVHADMIAERVPPEFR